MALSALDLFSVGIGPSSSHTVGPMRAAGLFLDAMRRDGVLERVRRVSCELFGSLALTGRGHGSDKAVILGLMGEDPQTVDIETADERVDDACRTGRLLLGASHAIGFDRSTDIVMHMRKSLPAHPNGMVFRAQDQTGEVLAEQTYFSVGGGFVVDGEAI